MSRTPPDWTYLVAEVDAMAAFLRPARMLWRDYTSALLDGGPLMVLLATGCEKLLKLTLVLAVKRPLSDYQFRDLNHKGVM